MFIIIIIKHTHTYTDRGKHLFLVPEDKRRREGGRRRRSDKSAPNETVQLI